MYKQAKEARKLMGDPQIKYDEFNLIHIFMVVVFILIIILITYTNHKVEKKIEKKENTNNLIIKDFQEVNEIENQFEIYGDVNPENKKIYELIK